MNEETLKRARLPRTVWFTGLSGAGKSTLAQRLAMQGDRFDGPVTVLDGDLLRAGLCRDLGFTPDDRHENVRRVAEVARILNDAGVNVICALISPLRNDRLMARAIIGERRFVEVYVATPLAACEARDPKGLYKRARAGQITEFTGITSAYEPPLAPDLVLDTSLLGLDDCIRLLADHMIQQDHMGKNN